MVHLFRCFGSIESPLFMALRPCFHASVSARAVRRSTGSYGVVSERGQISYALPKPALTSQGVFTYQVHLVASLAEARAQGFTNLHLIRILTTTNDLYGSGFSLRLPCGFPSHSNRIYSRQTFSTRNRVRVKVAYEALMVCIRGFPAIFPNERAKILPGRRDFSRAFSEFLALSPNRSSFFRSGLIRLQFGTVVGEDHCYCPAKLHDDRSTTREAIPFLALSPN